MNYAVKPYSDKHEEVDALPRWAYLDEEWSELVLECDMIINDKMLVLIPEKSEEDVMIEKLLDL